MKRSGVDTVIVTGDITHSGKRKSAKKLLSHSMKYGIRILWVKGNHDNEEIMRTLESEDYYSVEMNEWKIIVLNTFPESTPICKNIGCMGADQLEWLEEELETEKKVLVAMHHPPYDKNRNLLPEYSDFENIIKDKADLVISGHLHEEVSLSINGIEHLTADNFSNDAGSHYYLEVE